MLFTFVYGNKALFFDFFMREPALKKNNDYFEMLKTEARLNCDIFSNILSNKQNAVNRLDFKTEASSLASKLADEFVPPIERTDIYLLSASLEAVFVALNSLECVFKPFGEKCEYLTVLSEIFGGNFEAFSQLNRFKAPKKLFEITALNKRQIETMLAGIKRSSCICVSLGEAMFFQAVSELLLSLLKSDFEIERVIINNN